MADKPEYLVGCGSDDHKITKLHGRNKGKAKPLILGGTVVSKEYAPVAHSDGDVVYHAITNAMMLAIGERDIGYHFPDTDPKYNGTPGEVILMHALKLVNISGYNVNNVTVMITAGEPRISPHVPEMKKNIAHVLNINPERVGVGATTGEKLTHVGRGKGISVIAQISLKRTGRY